MSFHDCKYILLFSFLAIFGCSPSDPLINSFDDQWRFVVGDARGISVYKMPAGELINASVWRDQNSTDDYPIASIQEFRDLLFAICANQPWIVVLSRDSLTVLDTINLEPYGPASDIAFANATTAYVTFSSSPNVGIVDITNFKLASTIPLSDAASGIAVVGNQLCAPIPKLNKAVIIDSRTNAVETTLDMPVDAPYFVEGDGLVGLFVVVQLGAGKLPNDERTLTTPMMTFIKISDRSVLKTIELTARSSEGPQQIVRSLNVNSTGFSFTPVQNGFLRAGNSTRNKAQAIQYDSYILSVYDKARAELICVRNDGKIIDVLSEYGDSKKYTVTLPDSISTVVGIAP